MLTDTDAPAHRLAVPLHPSDITPSLQRSAFHGGGLARIPVCGLHGQPLRDGNWCPACAAAVPFALIRWAAVACPCHPSRGA